MGDYTPNLSLYKPSVHETGWGSLVSGNFDTIDNICRDSCIWSPDCPPATASAFDDEFSDSSINSALWTEFDPGSVATVSEDVAGLKILLSGNAGTDFGGVYQSLQSGDFTYTTKLLVSTNYRNMYAHSGLFLMEGVTGSSGLYGILFNPVRGNYTQRYAVIYYSNYQTISSEKDYEGIYYTTTSVYLRIRRNGTNYYFDWSSDGISWRMLYTESSFPFTASHIGILASCEDATYITSTKSTFFRYKNSDLGFDGILEGDRIGIERY